MPYNIPSNAFFTTYPLELRLSYPSVNIPCAIRNKKPGPTFTWIDLMSEFHDTDDIDLIDIAKQGDADAYGELYERYAERVFRFLYAHIRNRLDAEDLTEEVFLRAWRSLPGFQHQGVPFLAYLFRIARHALIDLYRRSSKSQGQVSSSAVNLVDDQPNPAEMMDGDMERQKIHQALDKIHPDYRTVLTLRFLSELSPEETAQAMKRSPGAIRVLQHRALTALRKVFKDL